MSIWFDIKEAQRRQQAMSERQKRTRAAVEAEAEEAAAKENNNKPKVWNDQDFQIALLAFERYMHNKNDGEWNRWSRDVREREQQEK
jgi:hypothetical protein